MTDNRTSLAELMQATLADQAAHHDWTYAEVRPLSNPSRPWQPGMNVHGDCSKGCQFLCWWVPGCPDPMGMDFGPYGNSQTLWVNCQHLDNPSDLLVGDFITFGIDGSEHAAMVIEAGADPLLWSFGHQGAPNTYRLSEDGRPAQYLRNPLPDYVPTPDDKLRAKTTWFAWMQWNLGEGDWKHKKQKDKLVRPNVPRVIPPKWWIHRAKFLLNRKKAH